MDEARFVRAKPQRRHPALFDMIEERPFQCPDDAPDACPDAVGSAQRGRQGDLIEHWGRSIGASVISGHQTDIVGMLGIRRDLTSQFQSRQLAGEAVIDITVMGLVCTNDQHHVPQSGIVGQLPIMLGDRGSRQVRTTPLVKFSEIMGVADYRFFFEIANHTVSRLGAHQIEAKEGEIEHPLRAQDDKPSSNSEGFATSMKVIRCIRSFSASSISVRIQPLSSHMRRRHLR